MVWQTASKLNVDVFCANVPHLQELEGAKIQNRQSIREKLLAYSHARDNADYDKARQMDILRERIEEVKVNVIYLMSEHLVTSENI